MKKAGKIILAATCTAAAAAGTAAALVNVIDNLLVSRNWVVPKSFGDKIAGADMTELEKASERNMKWIENYGYERYAIDSDRGYKLSGYLLKPEKPSKVFVFGAHGYRSTGLAEYNALSQYYLKKGFNVFVCDHVASGLSEGKYIGFGKYEALDCIKWLEYLIETYGNDIEIIVHGISMGAATVMLMSSNEKLPENVKMIVSDCGYTSAWDEFSYKLHDLGVPVQPLLGAVNRVNIKKAGYDFRDTDALKSVKGAKVPMLFVHGGADTFVPTYMVNLVYDACSSETKDILIVDGADHAQSYIKDAASYEEKLNGFIEKFISKELVE